jgi:S-adenosylmethionine:tRNA ribosyltransferase-isomerase
VRIDEFDYALPEELIARFPTAERDASRLMVLDRKTGRREHRSFRELPDLLRAKDRLVLNDTKVLPARLRAKKAESGGRVEILLVEPVKTPNRWRVMVNASKPVRAGARLVLDRDPGVAFTVAAEEGEGFVLLDVPSPGAITLAERHGEIPLPPYLGRSAVESDAERYQTVYARDDAARSVAAPTAGLHFTPRLLEALAERGVAQSRLLLHVGPGTFLPVRVDDIDRHRMISEPYELCERSAAEIEATRRENGRIVAVGTTVTRVLETIGCPARAGSGSTDLFIRPGHRFEAIDALVTNFHLPRSTLIMLVAAFAGREVILDAYAEAVGARYRFFSYGDAMLIV